VLERAAWQRNIQVWDELAAKLPENEDVLMSKAGSRSGMAGLERDAENFEHPIQLHLVARAIRSELAKKNSENVDFQYQLANDWHVIGVVAMNAEDRAEARRYFQLALTDDEKLAAENSGETDAEEHIVLVQRLIGELASEEDQWPEAQAVRYQKPPVKIPRTTSGGGSGGGSGSTGKAAPLSSGQLAEAKKAAVDYKEGFSSDGYPHKPPPEMVAKLSRLSVTQREGINQQMQGYRNQGLGLEERRKIYERLVEREGGRR
jgi:hypothetical protein